ncbi:MAG: DNA polymerase III subunit gamma/tau [Candidatus Aminicenantales bacterium]
MTYIIFARKYRPTTFDQMIGQKTVVQTLKNAIKNNRVGQAYIFSGMRGIGKTTAARILAKALNCQHGPTPTPCNRCEFCRSIDEDRCVDVLEIDGASNRGIEEVRSLREGVKYKPIHSRNKVIIIDEVHMLTREAFNALLKTLEEPPPNTVFIFATTEFHKVPATIVSRCQHFEFKKISQKDIINHLLDIAEKERVTISSSGLNLIAEAADGSLRDAQSLLDQAVAFCGENINDEDLREILGTIAREILFEFSSIILEGKPGKVFSLVDKLIESGIDLRYFYRELIEHFRNLLLVKSIDNPQDLLPASEEDLKLLKEEAKKASEEYLLRYLAVLQQNEQGLKYSSQPRIYLETLIVKLCHFKKLVPLQSLIEKIENLRESIHSESREEKRSIHPQAEKKGENHPPLQVEANQHKAEPEEGESSKKTLLQKLIENLRKEKGSLAAILSQYASFKIKGNKLEIFFSGGKETFIDPLRKEIKLLERVASETMGEKVRVSLGEEIADMGRKREKEMEAALKDKKVQYFMDLFKAQVISVEEAKRSKQGRERASFSPARGDKK